MGIETKLLGERDGFLLTAYKEEDTDSTPYDADCYDKEDIDAWKNDEWRYVTVVVTATKEGVELGEAVLGGCEDGYSPGWSTAAAPDGYVDAFSHTLGEHENDYDLPAEALDEAKQMIKRLKE